MLLLLLLRLQWMWRWIDCKCDLNVIHINTYNMKTPLTSKGGDRSPCRWNRPKHLACNQIYHKLFHKKMSINLITVQLGWCCSCCSTTDPLRSLKPWPKVVQLTRWLPHQRPSNDNSFKLKNLIKVCILTYLVRCLVVEGVAAQRTSEEKQEKHQHIGVTISEGVPSCSRFRRAKAQDTYVTFGLFNLVSWYSHMI